LAYRKRPNIIDIAEAIPTAGDILEYTQVDENKTVPAEPIEDLIQDKHLGIQAKETLNSKMRTSTRPGTRRPASRSGVRNRVRPEPDYPAGNRNGTGMPVPVNRNRIHF
jgi:hypothetical protein